MNRYSPTPSTSHDFHQVYYSHPNAYHSPMELPMEMTMTPAPGGHQIPQGRMAIPFHGMPPNVVNVNPHPTPSPLLDEDFGVSPFLPEDNSPYGHPIDLPPMGDHSPLMMPTPIVSPAEYIDFSRYDMNRPNSMSFPQQQQYFPPPAFQQRPNSHQGRPQMVQRHTLHAPPRPAPLHRQASLQPPARSASPHLMAGDVFNPMPGSPIKRPSSSLGLMMEQHAGSSGHREVTDMQYQYPPEIYYHNVQGISPARALGPAPLFQQRFSPQNQHLNPMITPHPIKSGYPAAALSSATQSTAASEASSVTRSSTSSITSVEQVRRRSTVGSDDENDSPTKGPSASRAMSKMQLEEKGQVMAPTKSLPPRVPAIVVRPSRPTPKPVISGGRTSAKFAKVAEDPGVEGVPPGVRSTERPAPSFACIIGQAILKCSAGGLSLEHIYRYVETAYPYFKNGDGAWRNSVRHNLSIHKMFETIPRTEKFPPGKGGIWIIHDDEKCHWPEENKFIKNFPSTHPHHKVCRQTLHERAKEKEAIDKAAREGKVYVPKKGKKGKKLPAKEEDDETLEIELEMARSSSSGGEGMPNIQIRRPASQHTHHHMPPPPAPIRGGEQPASAPSITPRFASKPLHPLPPAVADSDLEDDGDFLPIEDESPLPVRIETLHPEPHLSQEDKLARSGIMVPPRFERKRKLNEDDDNVFSSTKRVRVAAPLAQIHPHPQEYLDDSFITPERERPVTGSKATWSAFKTPALVNTSSSPGSSPMPPTVTRGQHHPSGLQQAWTRDDMTRSADSSSPQAAMLDAAFDLQPQKPKAMRTRTIVAEDEFVPTSVIQPKTPVSRSSAATDKTPRLHFSRTPAHKTPLFGSPAFPPPSATALLSTPMWEVGGCLDRMRDHGGSPIRSPMPPTSPTRYAMLLDSGASPRRSREFSL